MHAGAASVCKRMSVECVCMCRYHIYLIKRRTFNSSYPGIVATLNKKTMVINAALE